MHLGVDFDNTLVSYDELFYRCALERGLVPADLPRTKSAVRAHLWKRPDGNTPWTELQGFVYGTRMAEAAFFPGAREALALCRERGIRVSIISHKLEFPALGPRVSLRKASLEWMEAQGFFDPAGIGLAREAIFFESSREEKLARIASERCTHFVDDLAEVLADSGFPAGAEKWYFDPAGHAEAPEGARRFGSWTEIRAGLEAITS